MRSFETWIRRPSIQPKASAVVICFPHAGGSASYFRPLAHQLAPLAEQWTVQYPGREDRSREPLPKDASAIIDAATEIASSAHSRRVILFGHSMGAVLAYEVGRRLEASYPDLVDELFVSAHPAPTVARHDALHLLDDHDLIAHLRSLGGVAHAIIDEPQLMEYWLPIVRSDYELFNKFEPSNSAPVNFPITAFGGLDDPTVRPRDIEAWGAMTRGTTRHRLFTGGHFYVSIHFADIAGEMCTRLSL